MPEIYWIWMFIIYIYASDDQNIQVYCSISVKIGIFLWSHVYNF